MAFSLSEFRRKKTVRNIAAFAGGNLLATVVGIAGSLIQARYVSPEQMGIFGSFTIVTGYLTFLHLGVCDGLQREIPIQLGRGNRQGAERAAAAGLSWITIVSALCSLAFLSLAVAAAFGHQWMIVWGWLTSIPAMVYFFYGTYLATTFRTGDQFVALTRANVLQSFAGLLILPFFPTLGYYGAGLRLAVVTSVNSVLLHVWRPLKVKPRLDWRAFYEVIRIGLPLSGIGYIWIALWVAVEGSMILSWFGLPALGLFKVAVVIRTIGGQLALNVNQVIGVKIYEQYGRTGKIGETLALLARPMIWASVGSIPLMVLGWVLMPFAVRILMPQYVEATLMMKMMLPMILITVLQMPLTILWAAARLWDCLACVGGGFLAFVVCAFCLKSSNLGALGVIISSMVGHGLTVVVAYLLIYRLHSRDKRPSLPVEILGLGQNVVE